MIAILGCGPAGLLAAHACMMAGVDADQICIYSKKRKSHLYGAQYMGARIPGIDMGPSVSLQYSLQGTVDQYRNKVYGAYYEGVVSPQDFEGLHPAWDIRAMYEWLWKVYGDLVVETEINPNWLISQMPRGGFVFSSIPKDKICFNKDIHKFSAQSIWAAGDAPGRLVATEVPNNTITCFGQPEVPFYRVAKVFGSATIEWPYSPYPPDLAVEVRKPIHNNCDCWRGRLIPIGRYGRWEKGVLVHSVYEQVMSHLNAG